MVHKRILFRYAVDTNFTAGSSWTDIRYHYRLFGYACPAVQLGTTRFYRLYAIYTDNMTTEGENQFMFKMIDSTEVHFLLPKTHGGTGCQNRDAYNNWLQQPESNEHATSKIKTSISGKTISLHNLELQTWDFFE